MKFWNARTVEKRLFHAYRFIVPSVTIKFVMPKASTETTDSVKRAPRKRAVRRVVSSDDAPVRRTRTRAAAPRVVKEEVSTARKAPVYLNESTPKSSSRKFVVALVAFVVVVGAASWIGFSDAGVIDVTARINTSNQDAANVANTEQGGTGETATVPVQNTPPAAISGIRPRTDGGGRPDPVPVPETEVATTTATSTEEGTTTESTEQPDESSAIEPEEETATDAGTPVTAQ